MTGALADLGLSKEAKSQLDEYLGEVRTALAEVPDVNLEEIESDIREHVEQELRSALRPIPSAILEGVLNRLGPPTQWLPPGHRTAPAPLPSLFGYFKAKAIAAFSALWRGPEDWRLAYLSFFIFALGEVLVPVFPLMLIVSYLLARAGIAAAHQKGFEVDAARKWLLYPQLSLVGVILLSIIAFGPPILATIAAVHQTQELDTRERWQDKTVVQKVQIERGKFVDKEVTIKWLNPEVLTTPDRIFALFPGPATLRPAFATIFFAVGMFTIWSAALGILAGKFPVVVRAIGFPLLQRFEGRTAQRWGLLCLVLVVVWCAIAYWVVSGALQESSSMHVYASQTSIESSLTSCPSAANLPPIARALPAIA